VKLNEFSIQNIVPDILTVDVHSNQFLSIVIPLLSYFSEFK
jgi:hypothetical protein